MKLAAGKPARPPYWLKARRALATADPIMGKLIAAHPRVAMTTRGDAFVTLARSITGQQISTKAADAVWRRFETACSDLSPRGVLRRRAPTLRACGLSDRKVEYIRDLASHFVKGSIDPARFPEQDDEAIIIELTAVRGIGRWTAEMFLMFNLLRPNVLPLDDLGLLKAVSVNYFDGEPIIGREGKARVTELAQVWAPWRSVATWYLWRTFDPVPVEY